MDFLVLGDIHFRYKSNYRESNKNIGQVAVDVLADVFDYADKKGVNTIIHLGDLTDKARPSEDTRTLILTAFQKFEHLYPHIRFYTLIGNHDVNRVVKYGIPYPNTAIHNFELSLSNFKALAFNEGDSPLILDNTYIYALPYFTYEADFITCINECATHVKQNPTKTHILLFHQDLTEVIPSSTISAYSSLFDPFDYIFNGHLHNFKRLSSKFALPGSFIVNTVNDLQSDKPKGVFHVYTSSNKPVSAKFVPHTYKYPIFRDVPFNEPIPANYKGQFIRRYKNIEDISIPEQALSDLTKESIIDSYCSVNSYSQVIKDKLHELVDQLQITSTDSVAVSFKEVTIEGFRSVVSPVTFSYNTFKDNITYVIGDIGSGKTSVLLEALIWCLYGKIQRDPKNQGGGLKNIIPYEHIQHGEYKGTRITVEFNINEYDYLVCRHLKYKGDTLGIKGDDRFLVFRKTVSEDVFTYEHILDLDTVITSEQYPYLTDMATKSKNTKQLELLLGIPYELFVSSVIFDINRADLIKASSGELSELLEKLLEASWIDDLKKLAKIKYQEYQEEFQKLKLQHATSNSKLEGLARLLDTLNTVLQDAELKKKEDIKSYTSSLNYNRKELRQVITNLRRTLKEKQKHVVLEKKSKELLLSKKQSLNNEQTLLTRYLEKEGKLQEKREYGKHLQDYEANNETAISSLRQEESQLLSSLEDIPKSLGEILDEKQQIEVTLAKLSKLLREEEDLVEKRQNIQKELKYVEQQLKDARNVVCPECGQKREIDKNKLKKYETEIDMHNTALSQITKQLRQYEENNVTADINRLNVKLSTLSEQMQEIRKKEAHNQNIGIQVQKVQNEIKTYQIAYQKELDTYKQLCIEADTLAAGVDYTYTDVVQKQKDIDAELTYINTELNTLDTYNKRAEESIHTYDNLCKTINTLVNKKTQLSLNISNIKQEIRNKQQENLSVKTYKQLKDTEEELKPLKTLVKDQENQLKVLEGLIDIYKTISSKVCAKSGLKSFIISNKLQQLNKYCEDYSQYSNITVELHVDSSSRYKVGIYKEGYSSPACNLSGGESMAANLSLICALHDSIQENTGISMMILDEPFNHVRESNSEIIQDILDIKAAKGTGMFIITHLEDISNQYQKLLFSKDEKGHTYFELS